jgi:hypothetical protein
MLSLIEIHPRTRINDRWLLKDPVLKDLVAKIPVDYSYKNFVDVDSDDRLNPKNQVPLNVPLDQRSFLQVITETVYHYPGIWITEKSFKPILSKRPFVIAGPTGSLEYLRSLGVKTFSDYWDESYDNMQDPEQRLLAIVDVIEWVCSQSIDDLRNLCVSMSDVLQFNFQFYVDYFKNNELLKLEQACAENLKPRYDTN